jgi:hypothetical protein
MSSDYLNYAWMCQCKVQRCYTISRMSEKPPPTPRDRGLIDSQPENLAGTSFVFNKVRSEALPAYGASSYFGPALRQFDGDWVLQWRGESPVQNVKTKIDIAGDNVLRRLDYHIARDAKTLLFRRPLSFVRSLLTEPKARRGSVDEVYAEVQRLGLDGVYSPHFGSNANGEEKKMTGLKLDKALVEQSPTLWDIMVAHRGDIDAQELRQVDRFDAYGKAAQYKHELDIEHGYGGIDGPWGVFFRSVDDTKVAEPISNVPDIIPNKSKVPPREYHATTLAMFLVNVVVEELKMKDGDPNRAVKEILKHYEDPDVTSTMMRFIYNGRLTMPGDILDVDNRFNRFAQKVGSVHNTAAMRLKPEEVAQIRGTILDEGYHYLNEGKNT